ncbi:MAG TPA: type II toxin-antitoxin system VapC family toxin [Phototrophicaceae bacterium]|nr:type II toxin-antitoxin system VapC family toxin [Phototrophicaceae bacterium]
MLDTNAVIALQQENPNLLKLLGNEEDIFVPAIVAGELYFGAYKSGRPEENRQIVSDFIAKRVMLHCDANTGDAYGQIKYALRLKGRPIPENDIWIAALMLQYDGVLVTQDAHYAEVENLRTQKW